jgi:hypothetical protein
MIFIENLHACVRSVFSEAVFASENTMEPLNELEKLRDKYAGLEIQEPAGWIAAAVSHLTRFERPNLAIVAIVATFAIDAYSGPPSSSIVYTAFFAISLLGIVGGRRDADAEQ